MIRTLLTILVCLTAATTHASGQTLAASVSRERVYVGDQLLYNVVITDARTNTRPEVDFPAGVTAKYAGQSQNSYTTTRRVGNRNQRVTVSNITHQYRITALSPGINTIPAASLKLADGSALTSSPVRFEALLPEPAPDAPITITTPRTTLYAGESIEITVTWTMPDSVRSANFDTSEIPASLNPTPVDLSNTRTGRIAEFEFRGQRAFGTVEQVFTADGRQVNQFRFALRISPDQTGAITLGPARVVFNRPRAADGWSRVYNESDPVTLTVLPVPAQGKPDNFSGLIGRYTLRALANPTSANVGDPITLRVELLGNEPLPARNPLPDLKELDAFDHLFRLAPEGWTEQTPRQAEKRVYTTTIRALTDEATAIPPIEIATFDPETGSYTPVRSDPIQLDIRAVREATIADAIVTPGMPPTTPDTRRTLTPSDPAFWAPPSIDEVNNARPFVLADQLKRPAIIASIAAGPATLATALAFSLISRRRSHPARTRDRRLRAAEHEALRSTPQQAVRSAASAALGCNPESVTLADLERLPTHTGIIRALQDALAPAEQPDPGNQAEPVTPKDTRLAIRALRAQLKRQPHTAETTT